MDVLLVIDMQQGLFDEAERHDADGVVERINTLSGYVRKKGGRVVFVQHDGTKGDPLEPHTPGWEILAGLHRLPEDRVVRKTACDAFYRTGLDDHLKSIDAGRLIITGCATDFCVDTTLRAAASLGYGLIAISDAHTTADRPHLRAEAVIRHHNWVWKHLIMPDNTVCVMPTADYTSTGR